MGLSPHPRNQPDNLLSCCRVHDPGEDQSSHPDEEGAENHFHLLILPERIERRIRIRLRAALDQLRQDDEER